MDRMTDRWEDGIEPLLNPRRTLGPSGYVVWDPVTGTELPVVPRNEPLTARLVAKFKEIWRPRNRAA